MSAAPIRQTMPASDALPAEAREEQELDSLASRIGEVWAETLFHKQIARFIPQAPSCGYSYEFSDFFWPTIMLNNCEEYASPYFLDLQERLKFSWPTDSKEQIRLRNIVGNAAARKMREMVDLKTNGTLVKVRIGNIGQCIGGPRGIEVSTGKCCGLL